MLLRGSFLCVAPTERPFVKLLDSCALQGFYDCMNQARKADEETYVQEVYRRFFGAELLGAFPCSVQMMEEVAQTFTGPHEIQVRALAARIALGMPYGPDECGGNPPDGGERVRGSTPKPRQLGGAGVKLVQGAEA